MGKVNVIVVDTTGNKERKVGLPDDIKCGIIMVKLIEKIKLPSVGPDGSPISYKFIHKVTGRQLLESQTLAEAGIKDGDVLRLQPEITAGAVCNKCGATVNDGEIFCSNCGNDMRQQSASPGGFTPAPGPAPSNPNAGGPIPAAPGNQASKGISIAGIISGVISILFGLMMRGMAVGSYESNSSYGGDAYTGIQNAAAQTANNLMDVAEIAKAGFSYLLIAIGLIAIFYFAGNLKKR
jgi:hypothetical protein